MGRSFEWGDMVIVGLLLLLLEGVLSIDNALVLGLLAIPGSWMPRPGASWPAPGRVSRLRNARLWDPRS